MKETIKSKLGNRNGAASDGELIDDLSHRSESKKDHVELIRIKENVKWVIEENEALRQGMHEILDCIHNQDGNFTNFIGQNNLLLIRCKMVRSYKHEIPNEKCHHCFFEIVKIFF